jgi:hypothetical protein
MSEKSITDKDTILSILELDSDPDNLINSLVVIPPCYVSTSATRRS